MRIRLFPILFLVCSCSAQTGLAPGADAAAAKDGRPLADGDDGRRAANDAEANAPADSSKNNDVLPDIIGDLPGRDLGGPGSGLADGVVDAAVADLASEHLALDELGDGHGEVAALDGVPEEAGPSCQAVAATGNTVAWMASQCGWTSPRDPGAPAAGMVLPAMADAMSFRVRIDIDPETYVHQGYVSLPVLTEAGPLSAQGMEVLGPTAGDAEGQYFFDLRWANQVAPREGLRITLTASFSFACSLSMSRTIPATTSADLVLCQSGSAWPVWRAAGGPCDCTAGSPVDAGTDGQAGSQLRWQQAEIASGFPARMAHVGLAFNDKMWILGGEGSDGSDRNDVWSSSDGSHWSLATAAAAWSPRSLHRGVVFQDKMWIIDGVRKSDVWSSADGANWTKVVEPAAFPARYAGQVVAFADKMWIIGGYGTNGEPMNDVWSSGDGKTWTLAVASAPWAARDLHTCVVANGKIWILDGERLGDVWTSSDGSHWEQVTQSAGFPARMSHSSVFYRDKLWILGGYGTDGAPIDDVWMSADGASWVQQTAHAPWGPRQLAAALVFQDKTWLLGGSDGDRPLGDVWTLGPE